jgi:hypothetical protein
VILAVERLLYAVRQFGLIDTGQGESAWHGADLSLQDPE